MKNNPNNKDMPKNPSLYQKISLILFGLSLTIVILEIGLRIGGFTILSLQERGNSQAIRQKGSFRIMCVGESTTQNQYPSYLERILNQHNIGIKFSVIDKGIVSTNTAIILSQLEANLDKYQPDMVVTMMGCNDDGGVMYYKDIPEANTTIFKHCRAYRFMRLIYMHILNKLKKVTALDVINDKKDDESKDSYWNYSELPKKEDIFKKAIELNPNNEAAYSRLGSLYRDQGNFTEAERLLKKAIELNPNDDFAYTELNLLYRNQGKLTEAEQLLKKAIELNPNNDFAYQSLGWFYRDQGKLTEAEESYKKAIELDPNDDYAYAELNQLYRDQKKYKEAEQSLKKAIELNPNHANLYGALATIYYEMGNNRLSKVYAEKANNLRNEYYNPRTLNNYKALKQILDKRNIKLVCAQYPMRDVVSLKNIFKEEASNMIFVDNEKIFKDAVSKKGYKEYFNDMFGGDFGHCTDEGNNLLAGNIADAILKEVFGK